MRGWWTDARIAADLVAGRAGLWLPGALAWLLTIGWLPLVAAVASPPSVADLTFLGARVYTSGAWPWNLVAAAAGALLVGITVFVLVGLAEAELTGAGRRGLSAGRVTRVTVIGFVTTVPLLAVLVGAATAFVVIAAGEFTSPATGDPVLRTLGRIWPFLVVAVAAWVVGGVAHAAAVREVVLARAGLVEASAAAPSRLRRAGAAVLTATSLASVLLRVAYLAVTAVLLSVLWDPIEARLAVRGIDVAGVPLLVGFVAIWLCLVLGGGALHAWASVTWTQVLGGRPGVDGAAQRAQGDPQRP
jgi:hypothetical protein